MLYYFLLILVFILIFLLFIDVCYSIVHMLLYNYNAFLGLQILQR